MFEKKLTQIIGQSLNHTPTKGQSNAIEQIAAFLFNKNQYAIFVLKGYAGTGKTLLVSTLVKVLKQFKVNTELLAPTGRAAKVLSQYANQTAYTIHKKIYRQMSTSNGLGHFQLNYNKSSNTVFIVDEASMIANVSLEHSIFGSGRLLDDLVEYVYNGKNCRLMLVGDTAQLPPVGLNISPALDPKIVEEYNMDVLVADLKDVVRQTQSSGILANATSIRKIISEGNAMRFFTIKLEGHYDIQRIGGEELIETISSCYDKYGESETIVVTRSNKRANRFNEGIRRTILWRESELSQGDLLMIVKNNYYWIDDEGKIDFIANGDIAQVIKIYRIEEIYGFRFANVTLKFIDYENIELECKIFIDTLTIESPAFGINENQKLLNAILEDYQHITSKRKRWEEIKKDPYYNALQVKFAYAVTCHKAQGGQWEAVFVDHGYLTEDMLNIEYMRWFYTAFTRPKTKLFLVNFDKKFFEPNIDTKEWD